MNNQQTESFTQTRRRIMSDADNSAVRALSKESRNFFKRICQDYKGKINGLGKWCSDHDSEADDKDTINSANLPTNDKSGLSNKMREIGLPLEPNLVPKKTFVRKS